MSDQPTPTEQSPEHRAAVVAGIRALAQLVEDHPALPVPRTIYAQHTITDGPDYDRVAQVRATAALLGAKACVSAGQASARHPLVDALTAGFDVSYVIYAKLTTTDTEAGEQA